jgi:tryptophan-rich sensory protein
MKINLSRLAASILVCEGVGIVSSLATLSSIDTWYVYLDKPFFNPPSWLFGPVWTLLYLLMGISLYLVWAKRDKSRKSAPAIKLFFIQLTLNFFWSILFFGLQAPLLAFVEIVSLWVSIILTIRAFSKISKPASYLLYPYILWVSFAALLNLAIVVLN